MDEIEEGEILNLLEEDFNMPIKIEKMSRSTSIYDYGVIFNLKNISDYLQNFQKIVKKVEEIERIDPNANSFFGSKGCICTTILTMFSIDNLIIKEEPRDSYYEHVIPGGGGGFYSATSTKRIPVRRKDLILSNNSFSKKFIGFIEYTNKIDSESWSHALYSQKDDIINVIISPFYNRGNINVCGIYRIYNHSLENRLK